MIIFKNVRKVLTVNIELNTSKQREIAQAAWFFSMKGCNKGDFLAVRERKL